MKKTLTIIMLIFVVSCQSETFKGNGKGATEMLKRFLEPDADYRDLTEELLPNEEDYELYFKKEYSKVAFDRYSKMWGNKNLVIKPDTSQVEIIIDSTTTEELREWTGTAALEFPGGYKDITDKLQDSLVIYKFKFVQPGFNTGLSYDGLVYLNGRWVIFPKPWRVLK
ncbi:MAG: hypothetical protein JW866_02275 [Ignavibacteriales bacterium]|nr:hypothetical protein [Ignavibacteriales bacterium]